MKAQVFVDSDGQWRWRIRAGNGEIVCQSEAYTKRASALRAAHRFIQRMRESLVGVEEVTR